MNRYRAQLRSALEAVRVIFPAAFLWFGKRYTCAPEGLAHLLREEHRDRLLLLSLQDLLYRQFYCSGGATYHAANWDSATTSDGAWQFVTGLSEGNSGGGSWSSGWHVSVLRADTVGLTKNGLTVYVSPELCRVEQSGPLIPGAPVILRQPNGSSTLSPGFYLTQGEEPFEPSTQAIVRVYWNIDPSGAAELVRSVTRRLNDARLPFRLKLLDDPRRYARCDAAVLYLDTASYGEFSADHLRYVHARTAQYLRRDVPALTKKLCAGIGIAEEPSRNGSFGTDRCAVLAEGIISAGRGHGLPLGEQTAYVEDRFRRAGIDPAAPYLNAGSRDEYTPIEAMASRPRVSRAPVRRRRASMHEAYLVAAHEIGRLIATSAMRHGDECNWIAALGPSSREMTSRVGSLGPDLYDGTAGIALFLARLFTATDDCTLRDAAVGAIRHSIAHLDRKGSAQHGLYVGTLGIAVVAAQLGVLLGRDDLLRDARRLARAGPHETDGFDLIAGTAGRIIGHLTLAAVFEDDWCLEASLAAGRQLVATAVRSDRGISWSASSRSRGRNLTGFSHGTAGAALSLLELFVVSGEEQFKAAAEAAFEYERSYFDRRQGNWPDLREVDDDADEDSLRVPYSITWCHGAPGIALSRIRAAEVLAGERYIREARVALDTTSTHLGTWIQSGRANYSLCHGVAGNADVLLSAARSKLGFDSHLEDVIDEAAEFGLEAYGRNPQRWPCGVGGGGNPSLMTGWAGIGHFYLRLTQERLPTPLAPPEISISP